MKLLLVGATGGTGKEVLMQALEQGHFITAIARRPEKIGIQSERLRVIKGDILTSNPEDAFKGQDAVLCCLGAPATKAGTIRSAGTKKIIEAMKKANVNRLICQTSLGYGDSIQVLHRTSFLFRNIIAPFLLKATFREHHLQELAIKKSGLNWTIVRPGNLTNGKKTESYKYGFSYADPTIKVRVSRTDVAHFLLRQASSAENNYKTIGISY